MPPPHDPIDRQIDGRIDERFDAETTRSSFAILLAGFAVLMAAVAGIAVLIIGGEDSPGEAPAAAVETQATEGDQAAKGEAAAAVGATGTAAKNLTFEPFQRVDPTLPAVPPGPVKHFRVDVFEHVTKVSPEEPPTRVWSFGVNGSFYRGTGVSAPMVVNVGDKVKITLVNGASKAMGVTMPHSIDLHSAEVAPGEAYVDVPPGESHSFSFVAKHPGVFMYHCATAPVLMHTGAGMVGMFVVKPKNLPPSHHEFWLTQQEYYVGEPGGMADMAKMEAEQPSVIAFNGYANQYKEEPIMVDRGHRLRLWVLNAGPSEWTAFHVIGSVFDRTMVEGVEGHDAQTISLAPSQGGYVELSLDQEGTYPFVDHSFADMTKGAAGALQTEKAPEPMPGASH
ncbi:MAG: multicopper oxidase domain-containing protein [Solirubrobacterales bacterium]